MFQLLIGIIIVAVCAVGALIGASMVNSGLDALKNSKETVQKQTIDSDFLGWDEVPDIDQIYTAETRTAQEIENLIMERYQKDITNGSSSVREFLDRDVQGKLVEWTTTFVGSVEYSGNIILIATQFTSGGSQLNWYMKPDIEALNKIPKLKLGDQITMKGIYTNKGHVVKSELVSIQIMPENE